MRECESINTRLVILSKEHEDAKKDFHNLRS